MRDNLYESIEGNVQMFSTQTERWGNLALTPSSRGNRKNETVPSLCPHAQLQPMQYNLHQLSSFRVPGITLRNERACACLTEFPI